MTGKYVIVRSHLAGVFFGILKSKNKNEITLTKARKFFYFSGANSVEDLATIGAQNPSSCKLTVEVSEIVISDFVQMLPCTKEAVKQNNSIEQWTQKK